MFFGDSLILFEVKYRAEHAGLFEICRAKGLDRACVVTKSLDDIGLLHAPTPSPALRMRIPEPGLPPVPHARTN